MVISLVVGGVVLWMTAGLAAQELTLDGTPFYGTVSAAEPSARTGGFGPDSARAPVIDVVGDTSNTGSGTGRAKGNAYRVDLSTGLVEAEFWLTFSDSQTLAFYVYQSPVELGTYTQVYTSSTTVAGTGAGWYSSGPVNYRMEAGNHYIIAVSWSGDMSVAYGTADSQVVSFGEHVHGYATGAHFAPRPSAAPVRPGGLTSG
jgi:hypothetical protein